MQFHCDPNSRTPIYQQLVDQVREQAARGGVSAGDRLPSVRQLSRELVVNPNTVAKAYTELERAGVLNTRQGLGVFVAKPQAELSDESRRQRITALVDRLLTEAVHLGCSHDELAELFGERAKEFKFHAAG